MNYETGQVLYSAHCYDDGELELSEHVVRTIRGGWVYAIAKNIITWGKLSNKHFDYGWLPNIPTYCRDRTQQGQKFRWLYSTKRQAWFDLLKDFDLSVDEERRIRQRIKRLKK